MGEIPDSGGLPVFSLAQAKVPSIPVVIAVPHAGRSYPPALLERMRNPGMVGLRLEDRHADQLGLETARATGATLLIAHAPRAMIDLNRAPDEVDWEMVEVLAEERPDIVPASRRIRSGLGLVPRRLPDLGELWKDPLSQEELDTRIAWIHQPYHETLSGLLVDLRRRWGAVLLIDLHSMPPLPQRVSGRPAPHIVLGDRFGASCDGSLTAAAFDYLAGEGLPVAHNRPYAGGYVLDRHGMPGKGIHAMQLEVCRSLYLDSRMAEPAPGLARVARIVKGLVRRLAEEVSLLGRGSRLIQAAE